ncbi:hypothetical protein M8J76_011590 [Diaphorina citri]|nr:hypothetical protein M8J76_011590 [Diaphorina citri]
MTSVEDLMPGEPVRNFKGIAIAKLDISHEVKCSSSMPNSPTPAIFRFTPPHLTAEDRGLQPPKVISVSTSVPNVNDDSPGHRSGGSGAKSLGDLDLLAQNLGTNFIIPNLTPGSRVFRVTL